MDGWMDKWMDGWINGWMAGCAPRIVAAEPALGLCPHPTFKHARKHAPRPVAILHRSSRGGGGGSGACRAMCVLRPD
eukprot:85339-Chlamydomonas_euryale.AAC.2